jgi:putative membrane protein
VISSISKYQAATAIAIFFHLIGIIGILFFHADFFTRSTPYNLLLMFVLLYWTQDEKNKYFLLFLVIAFLAGVGVEIAGVNTGEIFGHYYYGNVLGYKMAGVPLIIGINWFLIIYCCGVCMHTILMKAINRIALDSGAKPMRLKALSVIIDGATLAVFFDWVMEPVAVKLGYWHWAAGGEVPFYNYFCWFIVSMVLLAFFHFLPFSKNNKFAIHLLMIQLMFFLLLRTFL